MAFAPRERMVRLRGTSPPMRMSASWSGSRDPPNTRLWRDDLAPAAWFPSRRRLAEPMAAPRFRGRGKRRASLRRHGGALSPSFSTTNPSASPQGAKRPKRSAHPSRLDENAFFFLTKRTPYKPPRRERIFLRDKENPIQGRVRGLGE